MEFDALFKIENYGHDPIKSAAIETFLLAGMQMLMLVEKERRREFASKFFSTLYDFIIALDIPQELPKLEWVTNQVLEFQKMCGSIDKKIKAHKRATNN